MCLRRTQAQALCDAGAVSVGNTPARSARAIHAGDEITIRRGARTLTVRVLAVPATKQVAKAEASALYEVLREEIAEEPDDWATN